MKGFEDYLVDCQSPLWGADVYIDYGQLKALLKNFIQRRRRDEEQFLEELQGMDLAKSEREEFSNLLQLQLQQAATFYRDSALPELYRQIETNSHHDTASHCFIEVAIFFVTTVVTFRQALIRYDAFCRTYDGVPLSEWEYQREHGDNFHSVFRWDELVDLQRQLQTDTEKVENIMNELQNVLSQTVGSIQRALAGHIIFRDRFLSSVRQYFLFGSQSYGLAWAPPNLVLRGRHLKTEIRTVSRLRRSDEVSSIEEYELVDENRFPLFLNLFSCFLFMMNNYIIEPSSAYYANALGSSDALSGLMIGGASWFALLSSIMYSYWTNECYKRPIIFSSVLMIIGNLLYASAYSFGSMPICLLGRALTGLGAPRVINRRYVADAIPLKYMTMASAAFCLATALGSALGPGCAILLDAGGDIEFEIFGMRHYWNGMTAPGYLMAMLWSLYGVVVIFAFREPVRSGLAELKQREEALIHSSESKEDDADSVGSCSASVRPEKMQNESVFPCLPGVTRAVLLTMSLIFMKRIALESIVGSTSIITKNRYGYVGMPLFCTHIYFDSYFLN